MDASCSDYRPSQEECYPSTAITQKFVGKVSMFTRLHFSLGLAIAILFAAQPSLFAQRNEPARTYPKSSEAQIDAAIKRCQAYLLAKIPTLEEGYSTAAALALLKSGKSHDLPEIQTAVRKITDRIQNGTFKPVDVVHRHIYEAGVAIMVLGSVDSKKYRPEMEAIVRYIVSQQGPQGDWDYQHRENGDTSVTQYALLGLWEATRAGMTVPGRVWDQCAAWHIKYQMSDGGFCYHPHGTNPENRLTTHTMTLAGICNMTLIRMHLYPNAHDVEQDRINRAARKMKYGVLEPLAIENDDSDLSSVTRQDTYTPSVRLQAIDKSLERSKRWFLSNYAIAPQPIWQSYYLYCLERMATLTGMDEISGHSWYDEGVSYLVANQKPDGGWTDNGLIPVESVTSLCALFMGRATLKMMKRKPRALIGTGVLKGQRGLPDNLDALNAEGPDLKVRKMTGSLEKILGEISKVDNPEIESAQAALEDIGLLNDPTALAKQRPLLMKLAKDPRGIARVGAFNLLGKSNDLTVAPVLIDAVASDPELDCAFVAHQALRFLSRRLTPPPFSPEENTPEKRAEAAAYWKRWYKQVRPYGERDDLSPKSDPRKAP